MAVKIRLARAGRKDRAFYQIVVADARAPRDGRFIAKVGSYNPHIHPAQVILEEKEILDWISKGAQPTEKVTRLLSSQGILLQKHLSVGVKKGALTEEMAKVRFFEWYNTQSIKKNPKIALRKLTLPSNIAEAMQKKEEDKNKKSSKKTKKTSSNSTKKSSKSQQSSAKKKATTKK